MSPLPLPKFHLTATLRVGNTGDGHHLHSCSLPGGIHLKRPNLVSLSCNHVTVGITEEIETFAGMPWCRFCHPNYDSLIGFCARGF